MHEAFVIDDNDRHFFAEIIAPRLPDRLIDAHLHINLPEHVSGVTAEAIADDWALQCGHVLPIETAQANNRMLYPGRSMDVLALPFPLAEADMAANNAYLAERFVGMGGHALMTVRPEWDSEQVEEAFLRGGFSGFKPYVTLAQGVAEEELRIFDFMPPRFFDIAERHHTAVLIHLPRRERLADDDNVRDLRSIVERWPNVRLVLAHLGRCFNPCFLREGLDKLGDTVQRLWFDTAAVINPEVYRLALERISMDRILFGTDQPVLLWHGRREWTERSYRNLCREDFPWNDHPYPEREAAYVLFLYEQLKAILDAIDGIDGRMETRRRIFRDNAVQAYRLERYAGMS